MKFFISYLVSVWSLIIFLNWYILGHFPSDNFERFTLVILLFVSPFVFFSFVTLYFSIIRDLDEEENE